MRVALDARPLQSRPLGGVGHGLAEMLPTLAAAADVVLLTNGHRPAPDAAIPQHALRVPGTRRSLPWLEVAVPRWLRRFDGLFHGTFNALPRWQPVPMVVTIHDTSFIEHPEFFHDRAALLAMRAQAKYAARTAKIIVTVSEHAQSRLIEAFGVAADRIVVAHNACAASFADSADMARGEGLAAQLGVRRPYVIAMGGARRRRADIAVDAWRRVRCDGREIGLVLVGDVDVQPEPELGLAGPRDHADWAALLAAAEVFCYPTEYESFGMPALEACCVGIPVICPRVGGLPEVLGDAAAWSDSLSVDDIAVAVARVLDDGDLRDTLRDRALLRAAVAPSWADAAAVVLEAYTRAADI